ncbi:MAG TPA: hypothetical protein VGE27_17830 [Gemmatimonas sp.]|uniref:hypothetical protein n=1 Tax=Gemmatimonas sp. TaxID=1962908 RepID=UPI002ED8F561
MIMPADSKSTGSRTPDSQVQKQPISQGPIAHNEHFLEPSTVTEVQATYQRIGESGEREEFMYWSAKMTEGCEGDVDLVLKKSEVDNVKNVRCHAELHFYHLEELVSLRDMLSTLIKHSRGCPPALTIDLANGASEATEQRRGLLPVV